MATTLPPPPAPPGQANGVPHRTKGGFARLGRNLLISLPLGLSGLVQGGAPGVPALPADPEPAYFKTGMLTVEGRVSSLGAPTPTSAQPANRTALTFADRVEAQTAIERVFYSHRIWPKENKSPKPPFEQMVPRAVIEAKVTDSLKKSAALDKFWQHPVTGEMLQAELDRMAKQTRDPATLKELFEALHNDPRLIAETLARETLSDRLIRNWYAYDTRFHTVARAKAEAIAARLAAGESWSSVTADNGDSVHDLAPRATRAGRGRAEGTGEGSAPPPAVEYHHQIILIDEHPDRPEMHHANPGERLVDAEEFAAMKKKYSGNDNAVDVARSPITPVGAELSSALSGSSGRRSEIRRAELSSAPTPENAPSAVNDLYPRLEETSEHFILARVASVGANRIELETIVVPKRGLAAWWGGVENEIAAASFAASPSGLGWRLPESIATIGCDNWSFAPNLYGAPSARWNHTAVWTGSEMIVWGGADNSGGRYNPVSDSWQPTSVGANVPAGGGLLTAVWTGSEMIIWGGGMSSGGRYNPVGDSWLPTSTGANLPAGRAGHTAVWTGSEMIVWGGYYLGSGYFNSGGRYNPANDSWLPTSMGANLPVIRNGHTAVWTGSEMIVWGGTAGGGGFNSGGRYNPASNSWLTTSTGANLPVGRYFHTAVWTGSEMIVWGGKGDGIYFNSGGRYNPTSNFWLPTSTGANLPTSRDYHTAVWTGSDMIVWGGVDNSGGRYNPTSDSWQPTSVGANVPAGRGQHTAVWTGSEMIIWGGRLFNSGGRYNPTNDTWIPTSTGMNLPASRDGHTAIWTGSEMIVWGGIGGTYLNSGGRYNPASDSWLLTSTAANLPVGRDGHTAVWTGSEMIVWGGNSGGYNSGGRYNPVGDSWLPTSMGANLPAGRHDHTAVWTGSEMIVWGGNYYGYFSSGGRYNPANDSWQPTSTGANLPAGRYGHTAVWSGSEMIVWGGNNGGYLNTGGRYNPANDSWLPTSTGANLPVGRYFHTAVWTGSEMIVWGGYYNLNSGGRYNPANDSWLPTSTGASLPTTRYDHTAVWTGSEMIVWGGYGGSYLNSGGRYNPAGDSWISSSMGVNLPDGRKGHTAVWTGLEMIVWGGYSGSDLNTGGIYTSGSVPSTGNTLRGTHSLSINLNWDTIYGAGSYNVKRCNPTATGCIPGTIVSTPTLNQYSEPDDGISHFYAVEAVNQCGATP